MLPIDTTTDTLTKLFRISDFLIVQKAEYLAFIIKIPLISIDKYMVYRPIPLPIPYDKNVFILVNLESDYLALSNSNDKFFTLTSNQWEACIQLKSQKLCKGTLLIHHHFRLNLCKVMPLTRMQILNKTCNFKLISSDTYIWHRLESTNSWIF